MAEREGDGVGEQDVMAAGAGRTEAEVASQPGCWRRAVRLASQVAGQLPARGERVAVAGCGTSWFMAQSYAAAREQASYGETDAFAASEMPLGRRYDRVVVLPGPARPRRSCSCSATWAARCPRWR